MERIRSLNIGIPCVATITVGGVVVFLQGFPIWAYGLWAVTLIWLIAILLYRKQNVDINVDECTLSKSNEGNYVCEMTVLASSRHPDVLRKLELGVQPIFTVPVFPSSILPHPINSVPKRFDVAYSFSPTILDKAMKQQNMEWDIILWLEATTNEARWITDGFLVPARLIKDGQAGPIRISRTEGSLNKNTRIIKEKGRGINQKQFTKILNKASQPIKKSEK